MRSLAACVVLLLACSAAAEPFQVLRTEDSPSPADGKKGVSTTAVVRLHFNRPIDPRTLDGGALELLDARSRPVAAFLQTDLTGGVVTLTPTRSLEPSRRYQVRVNSRLQSIRGEAIEPLSFSFTTSSAKPVVAAMFRFRRSKIADRDSNAALTVGPDGNLYVSNTYGELRRYRLDRSTGLATDSDTPYHSQGDQIVGLCWDPAASADDLRLWISYARYGANFTGSIARLRLPPFGSSGDAEKQDFVTGLPHDDLLHHQPNGIDFGPDGRLYQSVGGVATLGGSPNWGLEEMPLSAAVLAMDVRHPRFGSGKLPVHVQTAPPVSYDPWRPDAPVTVYATGLRNAYDLCWHTGGHLFSATNQNSITEEPKTPASPDGLVPAINARPEEMLYRVLPGRYYGHPNPSRGEYVLNGGNPTSGRDAWEVTAYPVGVAADKNFDPALIYNLRPGGGNSANGMDEYRAGGPLQGRLLIAYFSGAKTIQTFAVSPDGSIVQEHSLCDEQGEAHRFLGAIDVACHPGTGRLYVADFGDWHRPHHGHRGAVWMLDPASKQDED